MAEQKKYTQEEIEAIMAKSESGYEAITKFRLKNQGGFVVCMNFAYFDGNVLKTVEGTGKHIFNGDSDEYSPGECGIPEGAICTVAPDVMAGRSEIGDTFFTYKAAAGKKANFVISGATYNNNLEYVGLTDC